ncbi:MAG TPA: hypothetical protein PLA94_21530 [Myxococcota bacterium]|nr:hypothetical protein [Myxococcota bacterium]HND32598.1 hypothetical protein [Myxococcota bacterium]
MPFPPPPVVTAFALKALDAQGIQGTGAAPLSVALGIAISGALALFLVQARAAEGQPARVIPPPAGLNDGSTILPGRLDGGITPALAIPLATGALVSVGLLGESTPGLGEAVGACVAKSLDCFVAKVQVASGAAIMGGVTIPPGGTLRMGDPPSDWGLQALCAAELDAKDIKGEGGKKLAKVLSETLENTFLALIPMIRVAPGVPAVPGMTTGPGMLL